MELNDSQLSRLDSVGLAEAIRKGELSPTEAVQSSINRIEEMDGHYQYIYSMHFYQFYLRKSKKKIYS